MKFVVRPALPADVAAMHALRCSVGENRLASPDCVTLSSYLPYIASGGAWVAQGEEAILGFAAMDVAVASVWALFVAPAAEANGVGRALHRHLVAEARRAGLRELWLGTGPGTRAERFYLKAGWRQVALHSPPDAGDELRLRLSLKEERTGSP